MSSYIDVLKWARQHKIKAYTDFIMMAKSDFSTSNLMHRIDLKESEELIKNILTLDENYKAVLELEPKSKNFEKFSKQPVCGVGIDNICLASNGNYYPCSGWQGYALGNAYKQRLSDVWKNSNKIKGNV